MFRVRAANRAILPVLCRDPIMDRGDDPRLSAAAVATRCGRTAAGSSLGETDKVGGDGVALGGHGMLPRLDVRPG
jgi:hypothetical protein